MEYLKEEKEYLEHFLRPFRNKVKQIYKNTDIGKTKEWLCFYIGNIWYGLPMFDKSTMYKGMELKKEYTLEELGLFKE
mgnify:CR=1 FL=1